MVPAPVLTGATPNPPAPAIENTLTVSAPAQPETTLAPANAGWIPFTVVTFTAGDEDVRVNSITVERVGFGADGAFDSIALLDEEENQLGEEKSLRSNHTVEIGIPFTVPAHISKTYKVVVNMKSNLSLFDGQMPALQIIAVQTSARVVGLPIRGTAHTVNSSLVIGIASALLSPFDPTSAITRYINDTGVRFAGIRLTADSKEDLELSSIIWDQTGSAGTGDLANVVTVVNDTLYPTTAKGRLFTATFDPPALIRKGYSADIYIQGDLKPSGVNRTIEFDIRKSGNIAIRGTAYKYYTIVVAAGNTAMSGHSVFLTSDGTTSGTEVRPFFSGSVVTINSGTFTGVGKSI